MSFFSKTLDKLKTALKKTASVLTTDVRTLFIPGRQSDDAFLDEMEQKFIKADMGVRNVERIGSGVRTRWKAVRIRNSQYAEAVGREQLLAGGGTGILVVTNTGA